MRAMLCLALALAPLPVLAGLSRPPSIVVSDLPPPPQPQPVLVPAPQSSVTEAHGWCFMLDGDAVLDCLTWNDRASAAEQHWMRRAK